MPQCEQNNVVQNEDLIDQGFQMDIQTFAILI